jgi:hypothetical protein
MLFAVGLPGNEKSINLEVLNVTGAECSDYRGLTELLSHSSDKSQLNYTMIYIEKL